MHSRDPFDCTYCRDTEITVKSILVEATTRATTRIIIALRQVDTATLRFIVKATALVYHRCLIARRMMVIVGDVVSEIVDWYSERDQGVSARDRRTSGRIGRAGHISENTLKDPLTE